ncbi:septum formation protein Maf [Candidatus Collierbacteria bacterium CG17_big_fil_post_rev_8_21_14_2_50_45_7]|uniref:dTTP/UTP pyrophosphatase n=2 Tax=Candidatus Collieribacteriota TaxID=1752725 RepID=A0A2M7FSB3_9BACT|nr:MAG: septum formation protein Maf [Candidatus Collierbacteria bacterium CG17_big_fil_post_rev_8_21_14_2_50_45_7]
MQKIILASGSPRRREILEKLGVEFQVVDSGYDEDLIKTDDPVELVEELALQKALEVAKQFDDALIIGGDTVVYLPAQAGVAGEILGKPKNKKDAEMMLKKLFGTTHMVVTGVAVVNSLTGDQVVGHEEGFVRFRELTESEFKKYLDSGKWEGFAGGYAIQGTAAPFVTEQTGSLSATIGFPIILVLDLLEQMGVGVEVSPEELEVEIKEQVIGSEG